MYGMVHRTFPLVEVLAYIFRPLLLEAMARVEVTEEDPPPKLRKPVIA